MAFRLAALFHDIGKIRVPDAILTKPSRLTKEEFELIMRHAGERRAMMQARSR